MVSNLGSTRRQSWMSGEAVTREIGYEGEKRDLGGIGEARVVDDLVDGKIARVAILAMARLLEER